MYSEESGVVVLTLNCPEKGNAFSADLVSNLSCGVQRALNDPSVHTLVFQGEGKHFCTGFDLSDLEQESEGDLLYRFVQIEQLLADVWHAPVRTAAVGHGLVLGAGADLFTACDIRLASAGSIFSFPGAAFGLILGTRRLAQRVGAERALTWTSAGISLSQQEAIACGLASRSHDGTAREDWTRLRTDRSTFSALRTATCPDERDRDLAALIRSVTKSGLKARLLAHRNRAMATAAQRKKTSPL